MITGEYNIYHLPCGDFCSSTCLDQAEGVPEIEVRHNKATRNEPEMI